MRHAWLTFVYLLDAGKGRKSRFGKPVILPQRLYIDLRDVMGDVDNKALICVSMTMGRLEVFQEMLTMQRHENEVRIKVMKLDASAQLPRYAHTGVFGDLAADLFAVAAVTLDAGATVAVATGVAMEFPSSHGALVEDRSGLAVRGVTTLAGVIDPGYRGEIKVVMTNLSAVPVEIKAGDRIAQLRIVRRIEAEFDEVSELVEASRGANGFGSTGR
jgi:dUTP pyrophosphatase